MAIEDFTTWTQRHAQSGFTVVSDTLTLTAVNGATAQDWYKSMGANFFPGDFTHTFEAKFTSLTGSPFCFMWGVGEADESFIAGSGTGRYWLGYDDENGGAYLWEHHNGTSYYSSSTTFTTSVWYMTIIRDEATGANGTLYAKKYADSGRTDLKSTQSIALHAKRDYSYGHSYNGGWGTSGNITGYIKNMDMGALASGHPSMKRWGGVPHMRVGQGGW